MKRNLLLGLLLSFSTALAAPPPYVGFACVIYDRVCPDIRGDYCKGYEGWSVGGQFPTTFTVVWDPPATGCLSNTSFCSANIDVPAVGEAIFYYAEASNAQGKMAECGPTPPPPGSGEVCAYTMAEVDYHGHGQ